MNNFVIGICLFSGFFLGALIDVFSHFMGGNPGDANTSSADKEIEMQNKNAVEEGKVGTNDVGLEKKGMFAITPNKWGRIVGTIIVGDFMHNFSWPHFARVCISKGKSYSARVCISF